MLDSSWQSFILALYIHSKPLPHAGMSGYSCLFFFAHTCEYMISIFKSAQSFVIIYHYYFKAKEAANAI